MSRLTEKLNIKEIKRNAIHISDTKKEMLNYISKFGFRNNDKIIIMRRNKKWIVLLK